MIRVALAVIAMGVVFAPAASADPFKNCTAARKAGYSNIPSSSPYYGPWLDKDGDGIGCEA